MNFKNGLKSRFRSRIAKSTFIALALIMVVATSATYAELGLGTSPRSASQAGAVNLQSGLLGYWKLDGNTRDATPSGRVGTPTAATPTVDRNGNPNGAYAFDRTVPSSAITYGRPANLQLSNAITVSAWVKGSNWGSTGDFNGVVNYGTGGYWLIVDQAGRPRFYLSNSANETSFPSAPNPISTNVWHLLTATYDGANMRLYVDGSLAITASRTQSFGDYGLNPFQIGNVKTSGRPFNGAIDDVRIYNRAISANEVGALFDGDTSSLMPANGGKNLLLRYEMNDSPIRDASPNGMNPLSTIGVSPAADRFGGAKGAVSLGGGSNDGLYFSSYNLLDTFSGLTLSSWVKFRAVGQTNNDSLFVKRSLASTAAPGFGMYYLTATDSIVVDFGGSNYRWNTGYKPPSETWVHLAYTNDGTTGRLYVDGHLQGSSVAGSLANAQTVSPFAIGKTPQNTGNYACACSLDDVRIYSSALSEGEVSTLAAVNNSVVALGGTGAANSVSLGKDLRGHWELDGNGKDATPGASNCGINGSVTPTTDRKGRSAGAMAFGGGSSSYGCGSPGRPAVGRAVSVSLWLKPNSLNGIEPNGLYSYGSGGYWAYLSTTGQPCFYGQIGSTTDQLCGPDPVPLGSWSHLVVTFNGTTETVYLNGVIVAQQVSNITGIGNYGVGLFIGALKGAAARGYNGALDDIRVYGRAINAEEVKALYQR